MRIPSGIAEYVEGGRRIDIKFKRSERGLRCSQFVEQGVMLGETFREADFLLRD